MISVSLLWSFFIPVVLAMISVVLVPRFTKQDIRQALVISVGIMFVSMLTMAAFFYASKGAQTHDMEIWNGDIVSKNRHHDDYTERYSCNCVTKCKGSGKERTCNETCDTCTRQHYTVEWSAMCRSESFQFDKLDRTSRSVYLTPDPPRYTQTTIGEPCATSHSYTNYIKAVPQSLFRPAAESVKQQFAGMIPAYPENIYDYWRLNRVLPVKVSIPDIAQWNRALADSLIVLGPQKQTNAIVVLVNTSDPNYAYALQDAWLGGKKNDVVVIIGATKFPSQADWVEVLAMTDNEMFKIKLKEHLMALPELTANGVVAAIKKNVMELHKRKPMKDFEYLEDEIDPPLWVLFVSYFIVLAMYVVSWIAAYRAHKSSMLYARRYR